MHYLERLGVAKSHIRNFAKDNKIYCCEDFTDELAAKINEIETQYDCTVYAVTHEQMYFGECYNLLVVPKYMEDWDYLFKHYGAGVFRAYAYVWNKTDDKCSEFGYISLISLDGMLERID